MKSKALLLPIACFLFIASSSSAQQASADVLTILRESISAQTGKAVIRDATLTGFVEYMAGPDDETVPFSFKGTLSGSTRTDINLSSGTFSEIHTLSSAGLTGSWSIGGGTPHPIAGHNLMTDAAWCFPLFVVERLLSNPEAVISYIGNENGLAHFQAYVLPPVGTPTELAVLPQHLSEIDLFLDPASFLPSKLLFNVHPDSNALMDLQVSVEFSGYQMMNGVMLPMHIQRFLNNSLALDLRIQNAGFNSGLSQTEF